MQKQSSGTTSNTAVMVRTGVIGGLVGGIAMAMIMMVVTAVKGMGFFKPVYLIAATFHQTWAMQTGFALGPALVGAMLHMMLSIIFVLVFVAVLAMVARTGAGAPLWVIAGMVWGVIVLVVNQYIVLPIVDPAMATATNGLLFWWVVAHLMYGLVLGAIAATSVPATSQATMVAARSRQLHGSH
jgi:hypothetical protein